MKGVSKMDGKELQEAIINQVVIARVDLNNRFRRIFKMRNDPWWRKRLRYMLRTMRQNKAIIDAYVSGRIVCK